MRTVVGSPIVETGTGHSLATVSHCMVSLGTYKSSSTYEEGSDGFTLHELLTDLKLLAAEL